MAIWFKTHLMHLHRSPKVYFLDLRTRLVDKYDQEEQAQTMSHEEDSFDRLYSCLEKIMILSTIFGTKVNTPKALISYGQYGPYYMGQYGGQNGDQNKGGSN